MKQAEDHYKKAHALVCSQGNLTLLLLGPRYWMPSIYLIQYSVSSTETPGESVLPFRRKRNGASVRERSWQGPFCIMATPHSPSFLLRVTACPSFYISSKTSLFQRHSSLRDTAASETQQPQRHSSDKSSTLISNFARSRVPGNKRRGLSIWSLLTIAVLKFQLWNLFCATAWNRNVGAAPKFALW